MCKPIKAYSLEGLAAVMADLGQPSFRAKQLAQWLYLHHVCSYDDMTNLPSALRTTLSERFPLQPSCVVQRKISRDGTRKYLIEFADKTAVETVAIPSRDGQRLTVCFSTQVGCAMACSFCATGREGFTRNLLPGEMVDQIFAAQEDMKMRVSNLVAMGQGEPFLNYENLLAALRILNHPKLLAIGARHVTVSSCGILPGIKRFSAEPEQFTLAISLHSALQETRDTIMPNVASMPLDQLKDHLRFYTNTANRRVTLEYIMMGGVNDSPNDLRALVSFCDGLHCHVNLIPLNKIPGSPLLPSKKSTLEEWKAILSQHGTETTIRESRGADIQGACGQLKSTAKCFT